MDPSSSTSPSIEELQQKTVALEAKNADLSLALKAASSNEESILRIASSLLHTIKLQQGPLQPEGFWMERGDELAMEKVKSQSKSALEFGKEWRWIKIPRLSRPGSNLPNFRIKNQVKRYKGFAPFLSPFPLEIFEYIIPFGGQEAVAKACRVSFACLQLFAPKLHRSVQADSSETLGRLFLPRLPPSSLRLSHSLSLNNIRTLELTSSSLHYLRQHRISPQDRLDGSLQLNRLVFVMNLQPWDDDEEFEEEEGLSLMVLDLAPPLFSHFNPTELIVRIENEEVMTADPTFQVSSETATTISEWTSLRSVRLEGLDLVWDADDEPLSADDPVEGVFFLGLGGTLPIASTDVALVWDLSHGSGLPSFGWTSFLDLLTKRDRTLFLPLITSVTIIVMDEAAVKAAQALVDDYDGDLPPFLRFAVAGQEDL